MPIRVHACGVRACVRAAWLRACKRACMRVRACVCACVCAASVRASRGSDVRACVWRACMHACVHEPCMRACVPGVCVCASKCPHVTRACVRACLRSTAEGSDPHAMRALATGLTGPTSFQNGKRIICVMPRQRRNHRL